MKGKIIEEGRISLLISIPEDLVSAIMSLGWDVSDFVEVAMLAYLTTHQPDVAAGVGLRGVAS